MNLPDRRPAAGAPPLEPESRARSYLRALRAACRMRKVPVVSEMLDVDCWELCPPTGVILTNPSVVLCDGHRLVAAREVPYELRESRRRPKDDADARSYTWLYEDPAQGGPPSAAVRLAEDPDFRHIGITGLEDPRLFVIDGRVWSLWTTGEPAEVRGGFTNRIVLGEIVNGTIRCRSVLSSPHGMAREKNWMPFVSGGRPHVIYDISRLEIYEIGNDTLSPVNQVDAPIPELAGFSGSSQMIAWGDDWLCVCHRSLRNIPVRAVPSMFYVHHLVLLSADYQLKRVSPGFFFSRRGVEFCAGIAVDGDTVLMSYGENDDRAMMMELSRTQVRSLLG